MAPTVEDVLREVARLPSPEFDCYTSDRGFECRGCDWCDAEWKRGESHPMNDCLWPRAQAALTRATEAAAREK